MSVGQRTYVRGDVAPRRHVQTRTESDGREVVVEAVEALDIEGRFGAIEETVTETTRPAPGAVYTRRDVFRVTADRRRMLAETTESQQETRANGDTTVHNTWSADVNGHLRLTSRLVEQTTSTGPDLRRTDTTLLVPHVNERLRETERTEYTERIIPGVVRHDSTHMVRDVNGRWRAIEVRRGEVREIGPSERVEEETIQRPDVNGRLAVAETNVIRSDRNEQDVVIETYAPYTDGRPPLRERVRRTTTATADGGSYTVEEVEARNPVAPSDPLRVIRRTVTTVRPIGAGEWATERQVFERDVNGRLQLVRNE
jgi:hypothetical protein